MHEVGHDVVEQTLVVRDDERRVVRVLQRVHAVRDDLERVDVEAGISLVEDGEPRFEHGHLEDFVALLFAAGEADVHGALEQVFLELEQLHLFLHEREEFHRVELRLALVLAAFVERGAEEVGAVHAGNLDGILKREEDAFARADFGVHLQEIFAFVDDFAGGDIVGVAPGENRSERALAGAVGPHDGMDFTGPDDEVDALEDFLFLHTGVEVLDGEDGLLAHGSSGNEMEYGFGK